MFELQIYKIMLFLYKPVILKHILRETTLGLL